MRKLLLLLAWGGSLAAGRDAGGVVLRTQDTALRGADPEAVRALPLETGAARRDLQSPSDACHYVSVSGSTAQTSRHGFYEATGTCESQPYFSCLDCGSTQYIWYTSSGYWYIGDQGCGSQYLSIYNRDPNGDLAAVSDSWTEYSLSLIHI